MRVSFSEKHNSKSWTSYLLPTCCVTFLFLLAFKEDINSIAKCILVKKCMLQDGSPNDEERHTTSRANKEKSDRKKVLIYSLARSGSSFLGEIFNRQQDVFFTYEPVHTVNGLMKSRFFPSHEYTERVKNLLDDFFRCDFKNYDTHFKFISYPELSNPHFRLMSKVLSSPPFCDYHMMSNCTEHEYRQYCYRLDPALVEVFCRVKKHVIIKELVHRIPRSTLMGLTNLLRDDSFQAVYLVRDPRAVIWSMYKIGWIGEHDEAFAPTLELASRKVCQMFHDNAVSLQWLRTGQKQVLVVRYEDLVSQPTTVVNRVFKFLNMEINENTLDWVVKNTHGQLDSENTRESFSVLLRNVSHSLNSWRNYLSFEQVLFMQELCGEAMKDFGYVLYWDALDVWNTHTPTFTNAINFPSVLNVT